MRVENILSAKYGADLGQALWRTFSEAVRSYRLQELKTCGMDCGHFIEAVRRVVEKELFGTCTPIGTSLPRMDEAWLKRVQNATGSEVLRLMVPRVCYAVFTLRNKRGVGHLSTGPVEHIDIHMIFSNAQWLMAELIAYALGSGSAAAVQAMREVSDPIVPAVWEEDEILRVMNPNLSAREQVLILLSFKKRMSIEELRNAVGYKNTTNFKKIIRRLHDDRSLEMRGDQIQISPKGASLGQALTISATQSPSRY